MTKITIRYSDGKESETIECAAAILDMNTEMIKIVHTNRDLQFINWNKIRSYTLHAKPKNDTN